MAKTKESHIVCIIDRSGSMGSISDDAIGGFNAFLKEQQAAPGKARLTLVQFDHEYDEVYRAKPIEDVEQLNSETYVPRGMTALLDAVGRTIADISPAKGEKTIVAILTDGMENSSHEHTKSSVKKLIDGKRADGWEFIYLGANQDAFAEASALGIRNADTANFAATGEGVRVAYSNISCSVSNYRSA